MNTLKTAISVLLYAHQNNIKGLLIKTKRNGREIRQYIIDGNIIDVEAWHTEHTV